MGYTASGVLPVLVGAATLDNRFRVVSGPTGLCGVLGIAGIVCVCCGCKTAVKYTNQFAELLSIII